MSNPLRDTYETVNNAMASTQDAAAAAASKTKRAMGSAQDGAEHVVASARTRWWDGVKAVAEIVMMVRSLRANDALGWVGLARRRNPLVAAGVFGAGIAVGAGAALLFAPASGSETRRRIVDRFAGRAQSTPPATAASAVETPAAEPKDRAVEIAHQPIDHVAAKMPRTHSATTSASDSVEGNGLHVA